MNNDKQLTPEEHAYKLFPMQDGNVEDDINAYKRFIFLDGVNYAAQQTAAKDERIKELEKMYLDTRKACEKIEEMKDARIAELEKDLEAQKTKVKEHHDFCAHQDAKRVEQLKSTVSERDKAFDLLEEHTYTANTNERQAWLHKKNTLILSRVNKKPEQVDIVCPLCNGKGFTWALNRIGDDDSKECPRCKGIGKTTENKKPPYPENYDDAQFEAFNEQLP